MYIYLYIYIIYTQESGECKIYDIYIYILRVCKLENMYTSKTYQFNFIIFYWGRG